MPTQKQVPAIPVTRKAGQASGFHPVYRWRRLPRLHPVEGNEMTITPEQLRTMIDDLTHTGELSMLYRWEIADTIRAQAARITELATALKAARADIDNPDGPQFKRMREALEMIAGYRPWDNDDQGYVDKARAALASSEAD